MITAGALFSILVGIVVAQRAGHLVGGAAKGWIPNDAIMTMLGFNLIQFLPMMMSLTIFLTVLLTLTRWHQDSEMVIWFSSGLGITRWIRPIITFAIPVILIIAVLSFFVMPWATQKVEDYRVQLKSRDETSSISPGEFKETGGGDRVYFVESFDKLGTAVKNVFIHSTQHQKTGIIVANQGSRYTAENGDKFVLLEQGRRYEKKAETAEMSSTEFESYAIRLQAKEVNRKPPSSERLATETLFYSDNLRDKAELHSRLAIPVSAILLVLLAIPLSFVDPRAGRSLNLMFAILIFVIYNNVLNIFEGLVTQGKISPIIGLWPVHILFTLLAIYLFYRRNFLLPILPAIAAKLWPKKRTSKKKDES